MESLTTAYAVRSTKQHLAHRFTTEDGGDDVDDDDDDDDDDDVR